MSVEKLCKELEAKIVASYEEGNSPEQSERLASEFLYAQLRISDALKTSDLDARTRKSGVKAIRAAIRLDESRKGDKKPPEGMLDALVDSNKLVQDEQSSFDMAEVDKAALERYYDIFREAHIFFRGLAKGRYEG